VIAISGVEVFGNACILEKGIISAIKNH